MRLVKAYAYRQAMVSITNREAEWGSYTAGRNLCYVESEEGELDRCIVSRDLVYKLEKELVKQAGWQTRDNHSVFVYEDDSGVERAVWFHDFNAFFGLPEDVRTLTRRAW